MPAWVRGLRALAGFVILIYILFLSPKFISAAIDYRAKYGISSLVNLGNVENLRLSPYASLYADINPTWENSFGVKFPINQLIWNGFGESKKIHALDTTISTTYYFSPKFSSTASLNYAIGNFSYSRYGFGLDFGFEASEKISLASYFNFDRATFNFNELLVKQNSLGSSFSVIPHISSDTDLEFTLSYSTNYFSTTSSSYDILRFQGGLQQQMGRHSFSAGLSWGFDNSDYFVYGIEGTLLWKIAENTSLLNLVQLDYFVYEPPPQIEKTGKRPRPGSAGRRYNPQSINDSFISFMWYASFSQFLNL